MTDRQEERLVELLKQTGMLGSESRCKVASDDLLANGVIVPPCKVGDKVYRIAKDGKTIVEERIGEMHLEFTIEDGTGWHNTWWLKDYNIGVTTFLTKEEAEEELEKRCNNA